MEGHDSDKRGDQDTQVAPKTDIHQILVGAAAPVPVLKPHSPSATLVPWCKCYVYINMPQKKNDKSDKRGDQDTQVAPKTDIHQILVGAAAPVPVLTPLLPP